MQRIMFVCHGNICRSPMAEFILKDLVNKCGRNDEFFIASSATSDEEIWNGIGNPIYPPAQTELKRHGITNASHRATQLRAEMYGQFDLFVCMDDINVRNARRILNGDPDNKICKLMNFTSRPGNVSDPWYSGDFHTAYNDILEGCEGLLKNL